MVFLIFTVLAAYSLVVTYDLSLKETDQSSYHQSKTSLCFLIFTVLAAASLVVTYGLSLKEIDQSSFHQSKQYLLIN